MAIKLSKLDVSNILTGILVICALLITAMVVYQQFFLTVGESGPEIFNVPEWQELDLKGHRTGDVDAPVQIIEFFDYECPYCQQANPAIQAIGQKYSQKVSLVYEHFPLSDHKHAFGAAVSAECAARQNRFEAFHKLLFLNQSELGNISYDSLAVEAGVIDMTSFSQCVDAEETNHIVQSGIDLANKLNIDGIPTFLINDKLIPGVLTEQQLESLIKEVLEK